MRGNTMGLAPARHKSDQQIRGIITVRILRRDTILKALSGILLLLLLASPALAERWTFAAIGDNRSIYPSYRNVLNQIKTLGINLRPRFTPVELVLAVGDLDPVAKNMKIYEEVSLGSSSEMWEFWETFGGLLMERSLGLLVRTIP